ncbi:MAG TPA: hypothetical protein VMV39_08985 [Terracidiphilus sp.]|nr:hypothetical protein [Terracidiphilus sp.]
MRAISAADAVSLAVQRTKEFLFKPFRWGTYLKLGLVAILTDGFASNFNSSSHNFQSSKQGGTPLGPGPMPWSQFHVAPQLIAVVAAAVLLVIVLSAFVFYLITRLRFAYFHCLIHNTKEIRPGWWFYREQALRFFWLNVVVGFCFLAVMLLIAVPFADGFWRLFQEMHQTGHLDVGLLLSLVLPLIPIILLLVLAGALANLLLRDCMMPHIALDDATAGEAWSQAWAHIRAEKKQFLVYALLRIVLPIVATVGLFMVLLLPGLMVAGSFTAIEFFIHSAFANATGASALVGVLLEAFFGVLAFGFALLAGICLGGPISTGIREYALVFYGGRYRELGDILYPPPPATTNGLLELA